MASYLCISNFLYKFYEDLSKDIIISFSNNLAGIVSWFSCYWSEQAMHNRKSPLLIQLFCKQI